MKEMTIKLLIKHSNKATQHDHHGDSNKNVVNVKKVMVTKC